MITIKKVNLTLLFALFLMSGCYTTWDDVEDNRGSGGQRGPEGAVYIENTTSAGVTINLSKDGDKWREVRLESDEFTYASPNSSGRIFIRIYNDQGSNRPRVIKKATLISDRRYGVFYNKQRKLFDIGMMRSRS
ncbi:MAG: hypothetical protein AAFP70_16050 [Calditrichota bacterium]